VGRSIDDINPRRLPKVGLTKRLSLSGRGISSLEGINAIRGIEGARIINLSNNDLSTIEEGALASAKKLRGLNLSNNQLTGEGLRGLIGLDNLQVLILDSNNIETIPQQVLKRLPRLRVIIIRNNPISGQSIKLLRSDGYIVYTLPMVLTGANIKRAFLVTGAVAAIVLGALAAKEGYERGKEYLEIQEKYHELDEKLRRSASRDQDKANKLKQEAKKMGGELTTQKEARQVVERHEEFLRLLASAKINIVVAGANSREMRNHLENHIKSIVSRKSEAEAELLEAKRGPLRVTSTPEKLEAYIASLEEQGKELKHILKALNQENVQAEEAAEEERRRVEELRRRGREKREEMRRKYNLPGGNQ
jgi:Leucine-rich repeat (LRR) protein